MKSSRAVASMCAAVVAAGLLLPSFGLRGQERKAGILSQKWHYKIQQRVYLSQPSGWHSQLPWLVSSPAIGDLGFGSDDLEIVTGTEEGYYEWFPSGADSGRYICIDSHGQHLWDYRTQNNAGRASPGMADVDGDGKLEVIGGSTSGWMIHMFDGKGVRRWRYEVGNQANVLAPPAVADLTDSPGLETVAVALDGSIYCVASDGKLIWKNPGRGGSRYGAAAGAAIADLNGDGKPEVVVTLPGPKTVCLEGATGKVRWEHDFPSGYDVVLASPAIVPKADACWKQAALGREAGESRVIAAAGNIVRCLAGGNGKEVWSYGAGNVVSSSPAVGDVDGDGAPEVVFGDGRSVVCLNAFTGKPEWKCATGGNVYASPALADRGSNRAHRLEWPMCRHDPARTGFYGFQRGPLGIYVGSDDGYMHLIDGRTGQEIDSSYIRFPDLIITSGTHGALPYMSSPAVADIDGNGTLEIVFTLVDRVWCFEDTASNAPRARDATPPSPIKVEGAKKNVAPSKNHFALAQIVHTGGWNPTVPVHEKLLDELTRRANLSVMNEMVPLSLRDDDVARFPFLYMTGHDAVAFTDEEVSRLKGHLERGGFLFAEACCNSEPFERSIRALAAKLSGKPLERVKADHTIFKRVYEMKSVTLKGKPAEPEFYAFEKNDRIVFLFTNHDYGCSWGNPCCTSGCAGVSSEDSYRMMTNIIVYALLE